MWRACRGSQPHGSGGSSSFPSWAWGQALPLPGTGDGAAECASLRLALSLIPKAKPKAAMGHISTALGCSCSEFRAGLAQRKEQKAELIRALGLPLVIPAQHIEKQQSGTIAPSHRTKAKAVQGEMQMGFHHSQLCQKLCSLAWLLRALQAVSLSLHTSSVLASCQFWTPCPH